MGKVGWGGFLGKIADWFPGRQESKLNQIDKLLRENAELQKEYPLSARTADRIQSNSARIKLLRQEVSRIT